MLPTKNLTVRQTNCISQFLEGMRKAVAAVCVVTTNGPAGRFGVTVSSMTSVSASPPSLLVCVRHENLAASAILANGKFCVNLLQEHQRAISEVFAGRVERERDRFDFGEWHELATGSPALSEAAAVFDCSLAAHQSFASHIVLIGEVVCVRGGPTASPLIYHNRNYATLSQTQVE